MTGNKSWHQNSVVQNQRMKDIKKVNTMEDTEIYIIETIGTEKIAENMTHTDKLNIKNLEKEPSKMKDGEK